MVATSKTILFNLKRRISRYKKNPTGVRALAAVLPRACAILVHRPGAAGLPRSARSEQLYALVVENSALTAPLVSYAARDPCAGAGQAAPFSQAVLPFVAISLG